VCNYEENFSVVELHFPLYIIRELTAFPDKKAPEARREARENRDRRASAVAKATEARRASRVCRA
jgi:hypothetical protein